MSRLSGSRPAFAAAHFKYVLEIAQMAVDSRIARTTLRDSGRSNSRTNGLANDGTRDHISSGQRSLTSTTVGIL
jgi:hypothetical protein